MVKRIPHDIKTVTEVQYNIMCVDADTWIFYQEYPLDFSVAT